MARQVPAANPAPRTKLVVLFGIIAAVAAAVTQLETIHNTWCKYFGIFCAFEVSSPEITVSAGGTDDGKSDVCKGKEPPVCVTPSTKWRKLDVTSGKFVPSAYNGNYNQGDRNKNAGTQVGWYPKSARPDEICVIVYATTGACETKFSITGKLKAEESISFW